MDGGGGGGACVDPAAVEDPVLDPGDGHAAIDRTPGMCGANWTVGVTGRVVNTSGEGLGGARTQLCITTPTNYLCLVPPTTDASGNFDIGVADMSARCIVSSVMRVSLYTDRYASTYCDLEIVPQDSVYTLNEPLVLYSVEPPTCLPELGDETAPRTITFNDGLALVDLRPEQFATTYYTELAAGRADLTGSCMLEHAPPGGLDATWGLRPDVDVTDGVKIRLPNVTGLAPGATVDLYVMGGLSTKVNDEPVPEGEWATFGTGTVDAEGAFIESDEGSLLPTLNWVGYAAQQDPPVG